MGHDYSYSQPSSSEEYDIGFACLLQAEADAYPDEAESSYNVAQQVQYPPQPECDDGILKTCYCGAEPVVATSYTSKDPGRRYFTCENVDDGECHVWKWFDVGVMEEFSDFGRQLRQLKDKNDELEQKMMMLEKRLSQQKRFVFVVCVMVSVLIIVVASKSWRVLHASV